MRSQEDMYAAYFLAVISMIYVVGVTYTGAFLFGLNLNNVFYTIIDIITESNLKHGADFKQ